jgi:hypothetical protein
LFRDRDGYAGKVPTRDYIAAVYKKNHHAVRPFLDAKMKKIDLQYLIMDASYKAAKKLAKYNGASVYDLILQSLEDPIEKLHKIDGLMDAVYCHLRDYEVREESKRKQEAIGKNYAVKLQNEHIKLLHLYIYISRKPVDANNQQTNEATNHVLC